MSWTTWWRPDENFTVTISGNNLLAGVTITDDEATGTITNDDSAGISIANASAEEGASVQFTVTLSAPVSQVVSLKWTTADGTAEAPGDYTAEASGTVVFTALSATTTVMVDTTGEDVVEPDENFSVTLSEPVGGLPDDVSIDATRASANGTIANDDSAEITITGMPDGERGRRGAVHRHAERATSRRWSGSPG